MNEDDKEIDRICIRKKQTIKIFPVIHLPKLYIIALFTKILSTEMSTQIITITYRNVTKKLSYNE